jgi:hypothetical protein
MSEWDGVHDSDDDVAAVEDEGGAVAGAHVDDIEAPIPRKGGRPRGSFNLAVILKRRRLEDHDEGLALETDIARALPAPLKFTSAQSNCANFFYHVDPRFQGRLFNTVATASLIGVDRRQIPRMLKCMAATVVAGEDSSLHTFLQIIRALRTSGQIVPITFINFRKYDETPIRLRVRWEDEEDLEPSAKLMVVERSWAMVLMQSDSQRVVCIRGHLSSKSVVASSMTAESIKAIIKKTTQLPPELTDIFDHYDNMIVTDEHPSNISAEHGLHDVASPNATSCHLICDIHKAAAVAKKTFSLNEGLVTCLVRAGLSVRACGGLARLRRAMGTVVEELLVVRPGDAGIDASAYRAQVQATFLRGRDARSHRLRYVMSTLLNGDYKKEGVVEHFCNGCCTGRADTVKRFKKYFIRLLFSKGIKVFPRSNWLGSEEALDSVGLLASIHDIGYKTFALAFGHIKKSELHGQSLGKHVFPDLDGASHAEQPEFVNGWAVAVAGNQGPVSDEDSYRKEQQQSMKITLDFLARASARRDVLIARRCISPQVTMIKAMLRVSAPRWDHEQMRNFLEYGTREFRGLLAYKCTLTKPLMDEIRTLLNDDWVMPMPTVTANCEAFRMLSRAGSVTFDLLIRKHRRYPFKLFYLTDHQNDPDMELAGEISDEFKQDPCIVDSWSLSFLQVHGGSAETLHSAKAQARLQVVVAMCETDTVSTERAHSANLRRSKAQYQTFVTSFETLAAWQTLRTSSTALYSNKQKRRAADRHVDGEPSAHGDRSSEAAKLENPKKPKQLGPWRAFLVVNASSTQNRSSARWSKDALGPLAERYRALNPEELEFYKRMGRALTGHLADLRRRVRTRSGLRERQRLTDTRAELLRATPSSSALAVHIGNDSERFRLKVKEAGDDAQFRTREDTSSRLLSQPLHKYLNRFVKLSGSVKMSMFDFRVLFRV